MDLYGYRLDWAAAPEGGRKLAGPAPQRLEAFVRVWDAARGEHPNQVFNGPLTDPDLYTQFAQKNLPLDNRYRTPPAGDVFGHQLMTDQTTAALTLTDGNVPISPQFVRDLCGRTIWLGPGSPVKLNADWATERAVTFPRGCQWFNDNTRGADLLEKVLLSKFRTLDMSPGLVGQPSGQPEVRQATFYWHANLYPYKLRPDTFYQDGWRLPQVEAVYTPTVGVSLQQAMALAQEVLSRWQSRPSAQDYEAFYESLGGDGYFTQLFLQGCTLIPTIEACNGYNQVDAQFQLVDFYPGRAVAGLHEVANRVADASPEGTILTVLQPGFVLPHQVIPARVVVSDGSRYRSPHTSDPTPLVPDLRLPHARLVAKWGSTHLPTHPSHFEKPALWGWCPKTGHFVQLKGPVWDPLHYHYSSTALLIAAYQRPGIEGNRWLPAVPSSLRRFHPIVPLQGFDTLDFSHRQTREEDKIRPFTSCKRHDDGKFSCGIGYHPLPCPFEYEIDNWWFPALHPAQRTPTTIPLDVQPNLCPVIECPVTPEAYRNTVVPPASAPWWNDKQYLKDASGDPLLDYPGLKRYLGPMSEQAMETQAMIHLEAVPETWLTLTPRELALSQRAPAALEAQAPELAQALLAQAEQAAQRLQQRHRLYQQDQATYLRDWWLGQAPVSQPKGLVIGPTALPAAPGLAPRPQTAVAAATAGGSPGGARGAAFMRPPEIE